MMRKTRAKRQRFRGGKRVVHPSGKQDGKCSLTRERESRGRAVDQDTESAGWRERNREGRGLMFRSFYGDALPSVIEDQNRRRTLTANFV